MTVVEPGFRRVLLHQSIQDQVKQFIIENGYRAGDPLPPEGELARQIGVSRPSMREAMRALQTSGVVEARHGVGTFVGHFSFESLTNGLVFQIGIEQRLDDQTIARDLHELVAIREMLESAVVARLAGSYSDGDIAKLYALTEQMEGAAAQGELFAHEDRQFHEVLHRRTENHLLQRMLEAFWTICERVREKKPSADYLRTTAVHHRYIVDALALGDGEAAARAMTIHFSGILRWFEEQGEGLGLIGFPSSSPDQFAEDQG